MKPEKIDAMSTNKKLILCLLGIAIIPVFFASCKLPSELRSYDDVYFNPDTDEVKVQSDFRSASPRNKNGSMRVYRDSAEIVHPETRTETIRYQNIEDKSVNTDINRHDDKDYNEDYDDEGLEDYDLGPSAESSSSNVSEYDEDSYYDYAYAARIRRFHRPACGLGYYNDYYTNLYWYTDDPCLWGVSIYLGYDWWYPYYGYRPYYYRWGYTYPYMYGFYNYAYGWNFYYPYSYFGYTYVYYPSYAYYYNARDRNSFYHSPASSVGGNGLDYNRSISRQVDSKSTFNSTNIRRQQDASFGEKYERSTNTSPSTVAKRVDANKQSGIVRRGGVDFGLTDNSIQRNTNTVNNERVSDIHRRDLDTRPSKRQVQTSANEQRSTISNSERRTMRTYTPPATRQPRKSDQYIRPNIRHSNRSFTRSGKAPNVRTITPAERSSSRLNTRSQGSFHPSSPTQTRSSSHSSRTSSSRSGGSSSGRATRR